MSGIFGVFNRAGIDDVYVGFLIKIHNLPAVFLKRLLHQVEFIGIDLTAEIVKCYHFH